MNRKLASSLSVEKTAAARNIQPSGLRGLRQASTKPSAPIMPVNHTGDEPPLALMLWCARRASGASTASFACRRPPVADAQSRGGFEQRLPALDLPRHLRDADHELTDAGQADPTAAGLVEQPAHPVRIDGRTELRMELDDEHLRGPGHQLEHPVGHPISPEPDQDPSIPPRDRRGRPRGTPRKDAVAEEAAECDSCLLACGS